MAQSVAQDEAKCSRRDLDLLIPQAFKAQDICLGEDLEGFHCGILKDLKGVCHQEPHSFFAIFLCTAPSSSISTLRAADIEAGSIGPTNVAETAGAADPSLLLALVAYTCPSLIRQSICPRQHTVHTITPRIHVLHEDFVLATHPSSRICTTLRRMSTADVALSTLVIICTV